MTIPKRPPDDAPLMFKMTVGLAHEHAVAVALWEALNGIWSDAVHMPPEQAVVEIRRAAEQARVAVQKSGWVR